MAQKKKNSEIPPRATASDVNIWCRHDEIKDVTELIENPRNPNKHPDKQIALLAKIIRAQGWRQPITVSKRSGFIVKGHGRLHAARLLQVEGVPVEFQEYASEAEEYADLIADNRIAELAEPDEEMLADLLSDDMFADFDLDLTGFDALFLEDMLDDGSGTEGLTDPDDVPDDAPPVCKRGQIWKLGDHRLMCGDSTDSGDVGALMDGQKADMVFTDPPYGISYKSPSGEGKTKRGDYDVLKNDDWDFDPQFILDFCDKAVIWGANHFSNLLPSSACWLVWDKRDGDAINKNSDCELAFCSFGGSARLFHHKWNGMIKASEKSEKRVHPTQKPIKLSEWAFDTLDAGKVIVDFFGGSGSTLIACESTARHCYTMELDEKYCDVIIKRWEDFTGNKAEMITDG
jgi:DNA modification methylase